MRVLLFNENPVVTKLVTLSAQKAGHTLKVCNEVTALEAGAYDLLIIDDALYSDAQIAMLDEKVQAGQKLLMASRGTQRPDGFDHLIHKPFLPTDLVDLFGIIAASVALETKRIVEAPKALAPKAETLTNLHELEELEEIEGFEDSQLSLDSLELDDLEADDGFTLDLDTMGEEGLEMEGEVVESLIHDDTTTTEGILDREDVAELQSLLEDTDASSDEEIEIEGLDDVEGLDVATNSFDDFVLEDLVKEDDEVAQKQDEAAFDLSDFDEMDPMIEDEAPKALESLEPSLDDLMELDETPDKIEIEEDEAILRSLDDSVDLDGEMELETLDEELLGGEFEGLEDEIAHAVSTLSDEDLALELDDDFGDEASDDVGDLQEQFGDAPLETFELDDLDMLDENSIKRALGEAVEPELPTPEIIEPAVDLHAGADLQEIPKRSSIDGVEALKALLKALEQQDVAKSLKGMNITVNISFGEAE